MGPKENVTRQVAVNSRRWCRNSGSCIKTVLIIGYFDQLGCSAYQDNLSNRQGQIRRQGGVAGAQASGCEGCRDAKAARSGVSGRSRREAPFAQGLAFSNHVPSRTESSFALGELGLIKAGFLHSSLPCRRE
jgi:hypothetical protein